jgi:hypothetical protein
MIEEMSTRTEYVATGSVKNYDVGMPFHDLTEIEVVVWDERGLNESTLALGEDYTITGDGPSGQATVVLSENLTEDYTIRISRRTTPGQPVDFKNQGVVFADVIEEAFDRLALQIASQGKIPIYGTGSAPTANAANAGLVYITRDPDGESTLKIILQAAAGTYSAVTLATTGA